jgi:hypothetical protein
MISVNPEVNTRRIATCGVVSEKAMCGIVHPQLLYACHLQGVQGIQQTDSITSCTFVTGCLELADNPAFLP